MNQSPQAPGAKFSSSPRELDCPQPDQFGSGPSFRVYSWRGLWDSVAASIRFLFQTEVHVYAIAVAANVLLTFFPFLVAIIILCRYVLHWKEAVQVILHVVAEYFPAGFGVDFEGYLMQVATQHRFSWLSVFLLLFTANGIFVPLEVALNRIFRVRENRSLLRNQLVSLGLIFGCGALVLGSVCITTLNMQFLMQNMGRSHYAALIQPVLFKITAPIITSCMIFLIYWKLPNARIPVRRLIPASLVVGVLLEVLKYVDVLTWPFLRAKLRAEVPPFVQSVSIIFWAFFATMILLAGAEWSARVVLVSDPAGARKTRSSDESADPVTPVAASQKQKLDQLV